jgi:hypothetical protein
MTSDILFAFVYTCRVSRVRMDGARNSGFQSRVLEVAKASIWSIYTFLFLPNGTLHTY